jgi:hypothetical protein
MRSGVVVVDYTKERLRKGTIVACPQCGRKGKVSRWADGSRVIDHIWRYLAVGGVNLDQGTDRCFIPAGKEGQP